MSLFFVIFQSSLSIIGAVLNGLLCYVAYSKSPAVIKTYSIITVNFAFTDFLICILNFVLQMRMIVIGKALIFVSYGPCHWMHPAICYDLYNILIHLYTHSIWLLLTSFCYRYYVMIRSTPSPVHLKLLLLLIYAPSCIQMILLFFEYTEPSVLLDVQQNILPEYSLHGLMIFGAGDTTSFRSMFAIVHVAMVSTPIVLGIFRMRRKIMRKLKFEGVGVHPNTRALQMQLLKALTFQAAIPLFYLIGVACYFISRLEIYRNPFFEYLVFSSFLFVPVLTPISAFQFIKPYRTWLLRKCRISPGKVESGDESGDQGTREEKRVHTITAK